MQFQIDSITALQSAQGLTPFMRAMTFLGNEEFFLLLLPLFYLCVDARLGIRLGLLVLLGDALNNIVKMALGLPRPYWMDARVRPLAIETSYGLPSSHAQNTASVWFFFAALLHRPWAWLASACLVLLISLSRVYLGVHFWTDILGGWILGVLFLLAFLRFAPPLQAWFTKQGLPRQITMTTGLVLVLLLLGIGARAVSAGTATDAAWGRYASEAGDLDALIGRLGALWGLGVGWAMAHRQAQFDAGGPFVRRLLRFVLGMIGVLFFWKGLPVVSPAEPAVFALLFRFARYALMTWWVVFLAPWLFLKLRLAQPTRAVAA